MNAAALKKLEAHFAALKELVPLHPIHSELEYDAAVEAIDALLEAGAHVQGHPLGDLLALLGELVGDYDDKHYPIGDVSGPDMLRFIMEQNGLTQSDLPEIGSQGLVSDLLRGKREFNMRHVKALKARFGVSADAFA